MNYADFFVSNVAHCTHPTLSSCLIHSNHINQACAIAFVNKSRYSLERCTKICFLSSGAIIVSFSLSHSFSFTLAHSLTFNISSWSFLAKPSRKMHCTCVINKIKKDLNGFCLKYFLCNLTLICAYLKASKQTS